MIAVEVIVVCIVVNDIAKLRDAIEHNSYLAFMDRLKRHRKLTRQLLVSFKDVIEKDITFSHWLY